MGDFLIPSVVPKDYVHYQPCCMAPLVMLASSHAGRCVTTYAHLKDQTMSWYLQMANLKKNASYAAEIQASLQQHRNEIVLLLNR